MSITDELRKWAKEHLSRSSILAIADRIDATHNEAMQREHEVGYAEGCGAGLATVALGAPEWIAQHEGEMAKQGWIRLPKDTDGVPWNVGDRDEDGNTVTQLRLSSDGWYAVTDGLSAYHPEQRRHYHAPTVEDVLHEFICDHEEGVRDEVDLIAEYAAKLRLAEGEDA